MKKTIFLTLCILLSTTYAQVGVASLSQTPILLHPSMVGSSQSKRASVVYGVSECNDIKPSSQVYTYVANPSPEFPFTKNEYYLKNNFTATYDQIWKKLGSGIGGYVNYAFVPTQSGSKYSYKDEYTKLKANFINLGASFAPKYTIMKKKDPNEVRFTWSPSISIDFSTNTYKYNENIPANNPNELIGKQLNFKTNNTLTRITLGGLLNSKRLILGATLGYQNDNYTRNYSTSYTDTTFYDNKNHNIGYLKGSALFGISFPKREKSLVGFSYTTKISLANSKYITQKSNRLGIDDSYGNMNLRIWNCFVGYSQSWNYFNINRNLYVGYKAKNWKASVGVVRYNNNWSVGETSFMYTF